MMVNNRLETFLSLASTMGATIFCGVGGWGGIRTHERVAPLLVFKTSVFDHSTTHPALCFFTSGFKTGGFLLREVVIVT